MAMYSGVSRISFRWGGGGSNYFWNSLLGVIGGMLLRENFFKLCNLVRFGEYFAKILYKKL